MEENEKEEKKFEKTKVKEKKSKKGIVLTIIVCLLIVGLCVLSYFAIISLDKKNTENQRREEQVKNEEIVFSLEEYPKVDCSTATIPMAKAFMADFTKTNKEDLEIKSSKTDGAYRNLINGVVDAILVVEPSEDELKAAKDAGVELVSYKVANEGFVFFTNTQNKVDNLTLEQIQKIYSGEIKNWKDVGGNDEEIIAYQRPENSGSQTGMLSLVMKNHKLMSAPKENIAGTMEQIIDLVSDYKNNKGAIGYSYYFYASSMYSNEELKLLSVNGVMPTNKTIKSGEYPIQTAYYVVIRKSDENNEKVKKLVENMLSNRGQRVVEEAGYVATK